MKDDLVKFLDVSTKHILKDFARDCCIAAANIQIEALTMMGIVARPLTVGFTVYNEAMVFKMETEGRLPQSATEAQFWADNYGCWAVGVDPLSPTLEMRGRWNGHLTVVVEEKYMLDLTIIQADRPERDIVLQPMAGDVSNSFLQGDKVLIVKNNNRLVVYSAYPLNHTYTSRPDWSLDYAPLRLMIAQRIVQECLMLGLFAKENSNA